MTISQGDIMTLFKFIISLIDIDTLYENENREDGQTEPSKEVEWFTK